MTEELPGNFELAEAIHKGEWPHTMDAAIWAEKFCARFPDFDEGDALAWFANAIMAGYDRAMMEKGSESREVSEMYNHRGKGNE